MTDPNQNPQQYYHPAPPYPVVVVNNQSRPSSGLATASMVLGIIGLLVSCCDFGVLSILAVIFGHFGLNETKNGQKDGHGQAVAGLVLGYIVVLPAIIFSVWMIVYGGFAAATVPTQ